MSRPAQLRYPTLWLPVPAAWLARFADPAEVAAIACGFERLELVLRDGRAIDLVGDRRALRRLVGIVATVVRVRALVRLGPIVLVPVESHVRGALHAIDSLRAGGAVAQRGSGDHLCVTDDAGAIRPSERLVL